MNVYELNQHRRTIRKFRQTPISFETLKSFVDAARICPSAANLQPLRYKIIHGANCANLFPHLRWAGYLENGAPEQGEQPTAYIVIVQDLSVRKADASLDAGAAAMAINLCAEELGIGCCWIGSFDHNAVKKLYDLSENQKPLLVIALGYPSQHSCCVDIENENIRYYLNEDNNLCVPKRNISDVLL